MRPSRPHSGAAALRAFRLAACTLAAWGSLAGAAPAGAAPAGQPGPPGPAPATPSRLLEEAGRVEQAARRLSEDEAARRLVRTLGARDQQVAELRDQKLPFGDVAAALAVARAAGRPVESVVALWANARLNWPDVAARLGVPTEHVVRHLRRARRELALEPAR